MLNKGKLEYWGNESHGQCVNLYAPHRLDYHSEESYNKYNMLLVTSDIYCNELSHKYSQFGLNPSFYKLV